MNSLQKALDLQSDVIAIIATLIKDRFSSLVENKVFQAMKWINVQYWEDDQTKNVQEEIGILMREFQEPLARARFNKFKHFAEWKALKTLVKTQYADFKLTKIWSWLFKNHQKEFANILLLSSNSAIERVFNTISTLLSNRRLRLNHETVEDFSLTVGNKNTWTESNKDEILYSAVLKYFKKQHTMKMAVTLLASTKVTHVSVS